MIISSKNSEISQHSLIISCQSEGDDPFNTPYGVSLFAIAAEMGGAGAIRSQGVAKTKMILQKVKIPVIGLIKGNFPDNSVCITRKVKDVESLIKIGCKIVAIDGTLRKKDKLTGPEFIRFIRDRFDCTVIADLSKIDEARNCYDAGAHFLATTLSGYTTETKHKINSGPDFELVQDLHNLDLLPVIAEGRVQNGEQVKKMMLLGAWAVVIGSAITRPRLVINNIVQQIKQ